MRDRKQEREYPGYVKTQKKSPLCFNDENMSLEKCWVGKNQKYKGRVEPRDNIVKDDADAYAVFTE